ncbi:lysoplasmalogenase [Parafilimonas sp.]|uniref:lysoplasmalogenase n=1 Tax=Parafilimonas sp. TaxID=1969739 RepID=UPI003F7DE12F
MKRLPAALLVLFIVDFITDSFIAASYNNNFRYASKGLLMPLLLVFFIAGIKNGASSVDKKYIQPVCFALLFSFLGDVLLVKDGSLYFMLGIAAFLIAHIFYIILFCRIQPFTRNNSVFILISGAAIVGYVALLDFLFWPKITQQSLAIPVVTYSMVLGAMLFTALNLINKKGVPKKIITSLVFGAALFVLSDSIIAFNKFYLSTPVNGFYVMSTYCLAQFLIVNGAMKFSNDYIHNN